ncbi:MAG: hypothetical protein KDE33_01445 [Bacteroidetes bacterium]|nr:hypothetical protein [Bacteroidota bacterium]
MKEMNSPRILQAHCQSRTSPSTDQSFVKELAKPTQDKIVLKKFPNPSKKIKNASHSPTDMTQKINTDNGLQGRPDRTPAGNSVLPQLAVTCKIEAECYYQTLVLVDSEVLRNRQLRQHAKRCASF